MENNANTGTTGNNYDDAFNAKVNNLISNGYEFDLGKYIQQGFEILKKDIGSFIAFTLITGIINTVLSFIPVIGWIASMLVNPPLFVGFAIVGKRILQNEPYEFKDFFKGFEDIGNLFLTAIIAALLIAVGFILLVLPGIYLAVAYTWMYFFVVFYKLEFWPALESSRKIISKNWFSIFAFLIVLFFINILGAIALGIGLLFTIPLSMLAIFLAFDDIVGS